MVGHGRLVSVPWMLWQEFGIGSSDALFWHMEDSHDAFWSTVRFTLLYSVLQELEMVCRFASDAWAGLLAWSLLVRVFWQEVGLLDVAWFMMCFFFHFPSAMGGRILEDVSSMWLFWHMR